MSIGSASGLSFGKELLEPDEYGESVKYGLKLVGAEGAGNICRWGLGGAVCGDAREETGRSFITSPFGNSPWLRIGGRTGDDLGWKEGWENTSMALEGYNLAG